MPEPRFYLTTYAPLVSSKAGREACQEYGLAPFIDGSIRREPDLEHECPAISRLCLAEKFAPRLQIGDVVGYMTRKGSYGTGERQRRLTALLRVVHVAATHTEAAKWYCSRGLVLPNNCLVIRNPPKPLAQSHRKTRSDTGTGDAATHRVWELGYQQRARKYPIVVICEVLFRDLTSNAPCVDDGDLIDVFREVPGTQNPGARTVEEFRELAAVLGIKLVGRTPGPRRSGRCPAPGGTGCRSGR